MARGITLGRQIDSATGHRPNKLGGYSLKVHDKLVKLARWRLQRYRPYKAYSGMALGWDQAFAQACIDLEIPLVAAVPFLGQESRWPHESQKYYNDLLSHAKKIHIVSDMKTDAPHWEVAKAMQDRNAYMGLRCTRLIALWDGSSGGTENCIRFTQANNKNCKVINLWEKWAA